MPNRPKPHNLKVLQGTDRPDRTNFDMPAFVEGRPVAPEGTPPLVAKRFETLCDLLSEMRVLTVQDGETVLRLARRLVEIDECEAVIEQHGMTFETESGIIKTRPQVTIRNEAERAARSLLSECGLTPASRAKVSVAGGNVAKNAFAALGELAKS